MSKQTASPTLIAPAVNTAKISRAPALMIQRKCACGNAVDGSGMCSECERRKREPIQRKESGPAVSSIPSSVGTVLGGIGTPLDPGTRGTMESRFGTDFGGVRVHTDSRAAESARAINAQAYTVGNNIVFDHGKYDPGSKPGMRLLAHELAHTIQQDGLQTKSYENLSMSPQVSHLETEADRVADAATEGFAVPTVSKVLTPVVSRTEGDGVVEPSVPATATSASSGVGTGNAATGTSTSAAPATPTPAGIPGSTRMTGTPSDMDQGRLDTAGVIEVHQGSTPADRVFVIQELPLSGGKGQVAIDLYQQLAGANQLRAVMNVSASATSASTAARAGRSATDMLRTLWIQKHRWTAANVVTNWKAISENTTLTGTFRPVLADGTTVCDMDHIQELQVGGAEGPSNIQVLDLGANRSSGRTMAEFLREKAIAIQGAYTIDPKPSLIIMQFRGVRVEGGAAPVTGADGKKTCYGIEAALLGGGTGTSGAISGNAASRDQYLLSSGVQSASAYLNRSGSTTDLTNVTVLENRGAMTMIPGLILKSYVKGASGTDKIIADVDETKLANRSSQSRIPITLTDRATFELAATPGSPAASSPTASASPAGPTPTTAPGEAGAESATAAQRRTIRVNRATDPQIGFHYPYLSEGTLRLAASDSGELSGTGTLRPSIPLLSGRTLNLDLSPERLAATLSGGAGTRVLGAGTITNASLSATLLPTLGAEGNLDIAFGNVSSPAATANLNISATVANGFVATGTLRANIPRVDRAEGVIAYRNGEWSGSITISTTQIRIPGVTSSTVVVAFDNRGVRVSGGVVMDVRGNPVTLNALYENNAWVFSGAATITVNPLQPVRLTFRYANERLTATGETGFTYRGLQGRVTLNYDDGVITGEGTLNMTRGRMSGTITARYTRSGVITADGTISYQISPSLLASVRVIVDENQTVRLVGSLTFTRPIDLFPRNAHRIPLLPRPIRVDIPIAGISLGVTSIGLVFRIEGNAAFDYGVGPGQIRNLHLTAGFNPFDENPNFELEGGGELFIPASAGVEVSIRGALAVSAGIASISGGITATARAGIEGNLSASLNVQYRQGRFSVDSLVRLVASPVLNFGLEANVEAEALGFTYHQGYQIASFTLPSDLQMGAEFPIHYASDEPFHFPSLDDIRIIRPNIDVSGLMDGMLRRVGAI